MSILLPGQPKWVARLWSIVVVVMFALALALGLIATTVTHADAASSTKRALVTRAEFDSINKGDTLAAVARKTGATGIVTDRNDTPGLFFTGGPAPSPVYFGASEQRYFRSPNMRYYPRNNYAWRITFVQPVPGGAYVVNSKQAQTNVYYNAPANERRGR